MFGRLGWTEILVIVVLLLILFGHSKIPTMMKNVANGIRVFKKEMKDDDSKKQSVKKSSDKVAVATEEMSKARPVKKARGRPAKKAVKKTAKKK